MYRKYPINELYFDEIDHQNKAYFLGMLYADGWNQPKNNSVRIQLSGSDKEILCKLNELIHNGTKPLYIRKARRLVINGKNTIGQESYTLEICSKHISFILEEYGMTKAKSFNLKYPLWMDKILMPHFIRGYFDGDGSISITNKQISINIIGSDIFCHHLKNILLERNIQSSINKAGKSTKVKCLNIHGNIVGRTFLEWIYNDAELYLQRKYTKTKEILDIIPPALPATCSICDAPYYGCGYCKKHKYEFIGKKLRHERYLREKNSG